MNTETLEQALQELQLRELAIHVIPEGGRFTAVVTSPDFTGVDEAERQALVWGHLRKRFSDHELVRLEFIFTDAPDEDAAAE